MTLDWVGFVLFNVVIVCAYFVGKDAGVSHERNRNDRRRVHRLRKDQSWQ